MCNVNRNTAIEIYVKIRKFLMWCSTMQTTYHIAQKATSFRSITIIIKKLTSHKFNLFYKYLFTSPKVHLDLLLRRSAFLAGNHTHRLSLLSFNQLIRTLALMRDDLPRLLQLLDFLIFLVQLRSFGSLTDALQVRECVEAKFIWDITIISSS